MLEVSVPIAHELLAQCVKQGESLVQRASLVGDFTDYEAWKAARKQWIDPTVHALEHMYGDARHAREFADAVTCVESGRRWQEQYAADLECVHGAIEALKMLQGELAFDARSGAAPAIEPTTRSPGGGELAANGAYETPAGGAVVEPVVHEPPSHEPPHELSASHAEESGTEEPRPYEPYAPPGEQPHAPDAGHRGVGSELAPASSVGAQLAHQESAATPAPFEQAPEAAPARARRVVLAHGRDERWKEAVAHLLARAGTDEVTILNDHPEERARLVEHIGEQRQQGRYAIVLLTADDIGAARLEGSEEPYFTTRAGQSVVFEMGFLIAALTPGRVCVLYEEGVELPCALEGISHVRLDLAGTWQPKLLLALRRAGFDYDLNRLAPA